MTSLERTSSGLAGLDDLIEGGFPTRRVILVRGQAGSGKTTLGLQFLMDGVERSEPGVLVSVDQKPQHVIDEAAQFGWDLAEASSRGMLSVLDASRYFSAARGNGRLDARQVASDLMEQARQVSARRMVIDSLTSLVPEAADADAHDFLRSLFFSLEDNLGCTVLMTFWNTGGPSHSRAWTVAEFLASGVIDLRSVTVGDRIGRVMQVRKMRGTALSAVERPFDIVDERGLVVRGLIAEPVPPSQGQVLTLAPTSAVTVEPVPPAVAANPPEGAIVREPTLAEMEAFLSELPSPEEELSPQAEEPLSKQRAWAWSPLPHRARDSQE
jgi:circadian clock protein KaiC